MYYDETIQSTVPAIPQLIADEGHYSVWFKPYGMYSQGSKWGDHCTIHRWIERHLERPSFIVHRLDRAAQGLILIAHKKRSTASLSALFAQRKINKSYRARVHGKFTEQRTLLDQEVEGRAARSYAQCLHYDASNNSSLLEVDIETGRKHQIRRHLSGAGYPIIGDRLYGVCPDKASQPEEDLQLMAYALAFEDPESHIEKSYCVPEKLIPEPMKAVIPH